MGRMIILLREMTTTAISNLLGLSVQNAQYHMKKLLEAGLIVPTRTGGWLVAGTLTRNPDLGGDVVLARFDAQGQPDTGFGEQGVMVIAPDDGRAFNAWRVALQADGKLVVAGSRANSSTDSTLHFAVMRIIVDEGLLANCDRMGERMTANLQSLMEKHKVVGDVRGMGLFQGAELVADRKTKEPVNEKLAQAVVAEANKEGVIIGVTNRSLPGLNNTLCFSPALIATEDDIDRITDAVDVALTRVFG